MIKDQMENIYTNLSPDEIPWNMGTPPDLLRDLVESGRVTPCKTVDLGCGTGSYAIFLAGLGFDVTGIDISPTAIEMAKKSAAQKGVPCRFIASDVLGEMNDFRDRFDFAYDWQVLHHIFPEDRETYISNVVRLLHAGGGYLSVCFSEESTQFGGVGKYRKTPLDTVLYFSSEKEMTSLFEPHFNIQELKTVEVKGKVDAHKAIYAFMKKR